MASVKIKKNPDGGIDRIFTIPFDIEMDKVKDSGIIFKMIDPAKGLSDENALQTKMVPITQLCESGGKVEESDLVLFTKDEKKVGNLNLSHKFAPAPKPPPKPVEDKTTINSDSKLDQIDKLNRRK